MNEDYLPLVIVLLLVAFFLLVPPKWDPTVRLREWLEGKSKK